MKPGTRALDTTRSYSFLLNAGVLAAVCGVAVHVRDLSLAPSPLVDSGVYFIPSLFVVYFMRGFLRTSVSNCVGGLEAVYEFLIRPCGAARFQQPCGV